MAEDKKKPEDENPFSEEMPSVTRLLNRKSLKSGQASPAKPAPVKPAAPAAAKPSAPPKAVTLTGITKPGVKPPTPPPTLPKKPPPGGSGTKK
ncbi:MAG: hypothetical protein KA715_03430 [Xanthomonadaceae bacterium]|nr:hypothetical protein [Xanthomonadaceae bacterium]